MHAEAMTTGSTPTDGGEAETDPLMSIGMFSRSSLVSVKALRSYHELGVLVPASVDPVTSYRSYRVSQLPDAVIVKRLRDLDVPLKDIGDVLAARDPKVTRAVIARHEETMRSRLSEVTRIVEELQFSLEQPSFQTPVHTRDEEAVHALSISGRVDDADYAAFLDGAYQRLWAAVFAVGAAPLGWGSARYQASVDTDHEIVEAYIGIIDPVPVPSAVHDTGVTLALIPAATCAVATHIGGYDDIGNTYRQLGAWVARHATSADSPVREHYVVSIDPATHELLPPEQRRTEICWPIEQLET